MSNRKVTLFKALAVILVLLNSCGQELDLENFDSAAWQKDKNGCREIRSALVQSLISQKETIIGKSERSVMKQLGKPDKVEIFPKNVKQLVYFTEPGPPCSGEAENQPEKLIIEINSLGKTTLIYLQNS